MPALNLNQGHVYFLGMKDPSGEQDFSHYKIGITDGTVQDRINQLQTGNPFEIFEIDSFHSQAAQLSEMQLHKQLAQERVRLEWFKLGKEHLETIISQAKDYEEQVAEKVVRVRRFDQLPSNGDLLPADETTLVLHEKAKQFLAEQVQNKMQQDILVNKLRCLTDLSAGIEGITQVTVTKPAARFQAGEFEKAFPEIYSRFLTVDQLACGFTLAGKPRVTAYPELNETLKTSKASVPELQRDCPGEKTARTDEGIRLHQDYLQKTEAAAMINRELRVIELHLRDLCGESEGIEGICSYRREIKQKLDKAALEETHPAEFQSCVRESPSQPRFKILDSRAY